MVSRGIWQLASWVPTAGAGGETSSDSSAITHPCIVVLVMVRHPCGVSLKPEEVPCLVVIVAQAIGADTAMFCSYFIHCRGLSS